jgi:hypothetical protein
MQRFFGLLATLIATGTAYAHGPQIQVTVTGGKITTREIVLDGPYSNSLTPPKSVYVMPFLDSGGVTYARPNNVDFVTPGVPEFFSGPGLAYGYGYDATTNPAPFVVGSDFSISLTAGLKKWDGAAFVDPGVAQIQAYTGGNAAPSGTATTADGPGPFQSLQLPAGAATVSFTAEGAEVHNTARYRYLGDGATPSTAPDGIYLLSFQLSNDPSGTPSDPFYFVLNRNSPPGALPAAVASLGVSPNLVQSLVPEPTSAAIVGLGWLGIAAHCRRRKSRRS